MKGGGGEILRMFVFVKRSCSAPACLGLDQSNSVETTMATRTERFNRKPAEKAEERNEEFPVEPEEVIKFAPEEEAVSARGRRLEGNG